MIILEFLVVKMRPFWITLFAFSSGMFFLFMYQSPVGSRQYLFGLSVCVYSLICTFALVLEGRKEITKIIEKIVEKIVTIEKIVTVEKEKIIEKKAEIPACGIIYIMQRQDGILKFGKTINISTRLYQHKLDYGTDFRPIASWVVFNLNNYEKIALEMTREYIYREDNRKELRKMSEQEISEFIIDFTHKVQQGYNRLRTGNHV